MLILQYFDFITFILTKLPVTQYKLLTIFSKCINFYLLMEKISCRLLQHHPPILREEEGGGKKEGGQVLLNKMGGKETIQMIKRSFSLIS